MAENACRIEVTGSQPGNIFTIGRAGKLSYKGIVEKKTRGPALSWEIRDFQGKVVGTFSHAGSEDALAESGGAIDCGQLPIGYSEITFRLGDGKETLAETKVSAARIPAARKLSDGEAERSYFGMGVYLYRPGPEEREDVARIAQLAGVRWSREEMAWDRVEPARGEFSNWPHFESIYDCAKRHGIRVLGLLTYLPGWARAKGLWGNRPPEDPQTWREFIRETVGHFKGRINHWEIWNEPDVGEPEKPFFFTGLASDYMPLLEDAYAEAKRVQPDCSVLFGGLSLCIAPTRGFAEDAMELGAARHMDVFNLHGYNGLGSELEQWAHVYRAGRELPCWDTEIGFTTYKGGYTEKDQAQMVVQAYVSRIAAGMDKVFQYDFRDDGDDPTDAECRFGIIRRDMTPKPAYVAYSVMTHLLEGKRYVGNFGEGNVECYLFREPESGKAAAVVWGASDGMLRIPAQSVQVTDLMGTCASVRGSKGTVELKPEQRPIFVTGAAIDRLAEDRAWALSIREAPSLPVDTVRIRPGARYGVQVVASPTVSGKLKGAIVHAPEGWSFTLASEKSLRGTVLATISAPKNAPHGELGTVRVEIPGAGERVLRLQVWNLTPVKESTVEIIPGYVGADLPERPTLSLKLVNHAGVALSGRLLLLLPGNLAATPKEMIVSLPEKGEVEARFQLGLAEGIPPSMFQRARRNQYLVKAVLLRDSGEQFEMEFPLDMAICEKAETSPALDSSRGWESAFPIHLNRRDQIAYGPDQWAGPEDLSGTCYFLHDAENLYFYARVLDDIVRPNPFGEAAWRGDGNIHLILDTDLEGDSGDTKWSDDDFQFFLTFEESGIPRIAQAQVPHPTPGIEAKCERIPGGYAIRAKLPLASFPKLKPAPGKRFGVEIIIDDADRSAEHESLIAWTGKGIAYNDPTAMFPVVFR